MIRNRPFCNADSPSIAELWSRYAPPNNAVRSLNVHEFDALVPAKFGFDRLGLIVAEDESGIVGFVHAGFGPVEPRGRSHAMDHAMGTVAMLVVGERPDSAEIADGLVRDAIAYLRGRGAKVIYAGGHYPLCPFYWGIYGGSEFGGVLDGHVRFGAAALRAGFEAVGNTVLFEAPLSQPEPRDVRFAVVRRQFRVESEEDARLPGWWDALAIGQFHPTHLTLVDRISGVSRASAWTWEIAPGVALEDGLSRTALVDLEVHPDHRKRGLGRTLVVECFRHAREQRADVLCVQTSSTNDSALRLYASLGFEVVEHATLYRLPGGH